MVWCRADISSVTEPVVGADRPQTLAAYLSSQAKNVPYHDYQPLLIKTRVSFKKKLMLILMQTIFLMENHIEV